MATKTITDQDGKSKTSSAVDSKHYPEQHEVRESQAGAEPTAEQIRERAHQLWMERGRPSGTAERDWCDAEEQLRNESADRADLRVKREVEGSVQR